MLREGVKQMSGRAKRMKPDDSAAVDGDAMRETVYS